MAHREYPNYDQNGRQPYYPKPSYYKPRYPPPAPPQKDTTLEFVVYDAEIPTLDRKISDALWGMTQGHSLQVIVINVCGGEGSEEVGYGVYSYNRWARITVKTIPYVANKKQIFVMDKCMSMINLLEEIEAPRPEPLRQVSNADYFLENVASGYWEVLTYPVSPDQLTVAKVKENRRMTLLYDLQTGEIIQDDEVAPSNEDVLLLLPGYTHLQKFTTGENAPWKVTEEPLISNDFVAKILHVAKIRTGSFDLKNAQMSWDPPEIKWECLQILPTLVEKKNPQPQVAAEVCEEPKPESPPEAKPSSPEVAIPPKDNWRNHTRIEQKGHYRRPLIKVGKLEIIYSINDLVLPEQFVDIELPWLIPDSQISEWIQSMMDHELKQPGMELKSFIFRLSFREREKHIPIIYAIQSLKPPNHYIRIPKNYQWYHSIEFVRYFIIELIPFTQA
ncbi:hypothetical protein FGO68_gene6444 [Halteria grandinella]|uniref:Uncharacterized protein n=1 Tax=Halteria grandinella TaxID=5974 RepID=A0A8J8T221_HALGN|nr:hypothetical protein FGO68_gene6444 [Halteria grandinella]